MSRRQRLSFLGIAIAIAVLAVIILAAGRGGDAGPGASANSTPPAASTSEPQEASPGQTPAATPGPLLTGAREQQIAVEQGATVRLRVRAAQDDVVHVHGYDIEKAVPAGRTVEIAFKATITGIFEVELHHSGATIARLKVEPR